MNARAAVAALRGWRPTRGAAGGRAWSDVAAAALRAAFDRQVAERRLALWLPAAMGLGVVLYFAAEREPVGWLAKLAPVALLLVAWGVRRSPVALAIALGLVAVAFGFAAAQLRTERVEAPVLRTAQVTSITGFVAAVERRPGGARLLLTDVAFAEGGATAPRSVRLLVRGLDLPSPGERIAVRARLVPPPEAARPGGYDFAREAFFKGIGAVGSVLGDRQAAPWREPPLADRFAAIVDRARNAVEARIVEVIGGQAGAVSAALVAGKRGLIEEPTNDALRAAGIYHIVSVSGLHMVLAAGAFFWTIRALLALWPPRATPLPAKKIAAVGAMVGATAYCVFTGSEVATERSLIMTLAMLTAILLDRPALSMRTLAVAAAIVLAREPETLLGPSFQMSFAAVAGLIAAAEAWTRWRRARPASERSASVLSRAGRGVGLWLGGMIGTTVIASLATAPFAAYHFQVLNPWGLLGNAAALPVVSLLVMPAALAGTLALPFGVDAPVWGAMGWGIEAVLSVAKRVAALDQARKPVGAFGVSALALLVLALLWATLWSGALRVIAVVPAALGLGLAARSPPADVIVASDGRAAAVRTADGRLVLASRSGPGAFALAQWMASVADGRSPDAREMRRGARCDALACVARLPDRRAVSVVLDARAFATDCARAAIVVSPLPAPADCRAAVVLDRAALARTGAVELRAAATGDNTRGFLLTPSRAPRSVRPWTPTTAATPDAGPSVGDTTRSSPATARSATPPSASPTSTTSASPRRPRELDDVASPPADGHEPDASPAILDPFR